MKATAATLIALLAATAHAAAATVSLNNISPDKVLLDKAKQNGGVYVEDVLPEDGKTLSSVVPTNFFMQIMVDPKATITFNSGAAWKQAAQPGRSAFTDYFLPSTDLENVKFGYSYEGPNGISKSNCHLEGNYTPHGTERAPYFILSAKADYLEPCGDNQGVRMVCGKKGDKSDPEATCGRK